VLLSADPKEGNPACYLYLREGVEKEKEAIIVLTPFIFAVFADKNGKEIGRNQGDILHEIAHHILGHYKYEDQEDKKKEVAVNDQVQEWINQWIEYINLTGSHEP